MSRRPVLLAGLALALLCAASLLAISRLTRAPAPPPAQDTVAAPEPPPPVPEEAPAGSARAAPPAPPSPARPPAPPPQTAAPDAPPSAAPPAPAEPEATPAPPVPSYAVRQRIVAELASPSGIVQERLGRCATDPTAPVVTARRGRRSTRTVLMLDIEVGDAEARIVEVAPQAKGPASDASLACAQEALRGQVLPLQGGEPGSRVRIPLHVSL